MTGVSAIQAPSLPPELMEVLGTNETVKERLAQFAKAKADAEKAKADAAGVLSALAIGKDIEAARVEAAAFREKAAADADAAMNALSAANAQAQKIVADANAAVAAKLRDVETRRAVHEKWIEDTTKSLTEKHAAVDVAKAGVEAAKIAADDAVRQANDAKAQADAAAEKHAASAAEYDATTKKMNKAVAALSKS